MPKIDQANHALVIGSSMAGLITARVLANYFNQVTLLEKDSIGHEPVPRKGVPQGYHLHGLLAQGRSILEAYYPGISQELINDGALPADMGQAMRWYHFGGYKRKFTSGLEGLLMSRPLLETHVRRRTLVLPNISLRTNTSVRNLVMDTSRHCITGVNLKPVHSAQEGEQLMADLVVDASGRGSASPAWLKALGYAAPPEEVVRIDLSYATRIYHRKPNAQEPTEIIMVAPLPPTDRRAGAIFPIEGNRWIVTLSGLLKEPSPTDETAFIDFAKNLCAPDIYQLLRQSEPLSEIVHYKFASAQWRHYEQLRAFPDQFLVVGDAVCSFNPIFGQGMTSAVMQAQALDASLQQRSSLTGLWKPYFKRIAHVVAMPWQAATGEDFRYPQVQGKRPAGHSLVNSYVAAVHRATQRDTVVYKAFLEVMNLLRPAPWLLRPAILWRVLKDVFQHQFVHRNSVNPGGN